MEKKGYEDYDGWANKNLLGKGKDSILENSNKDLPPSSNSAIENNTNDLVSNGGSSGLSNEKMGPDIKEVEQEYLRRAQNFDRDEENPIYNDGDQTIK